MKAKKSGSGSKGHDADVWASPEFKTLSQGLEKILKLPKTEMDKRLAEDHAKKNKDRSRQMMLPGLDEPADES